MGYDYSSVHVFADSDDHERTRSRVIKRIHDSLAGQTTSKDDATRSIVVGPSRRWIFVGDTASGTDDGDPAALDALICDLSEIAPTLSIHMSDSACVHLYLRYERTEIDRFGTGIFPFYPFESQEQAASFRGVEQKWRRFCLRDTGPSELRSAWDTKYNADGIVQVTADVLGIETGLAGCGYTIFDEAEEIYYRDWLDDDPVLLDRFDELHFNTDAVSG